MERGEVWDMDYWRVTSSIGTGLLQFFFMTFLEKNDEKN